MPFPPAHWRDVDAWRKEGLPLSTTSNEAAKMFDATISQVVAHMEDSNVGGLEASVNKMLAADPDFLLGNILATKLQIKDCMPTILSLAEKKNLSHHEKLHVDAVKEWSTRNFTKAQDLWDDVIVEYPTDMFALNLLTEYSIFFGPKDRIRDSVARVIPKWKKEIPLYGYLFGMHAFGLEETNFYSEAEKQARKGLELIPQDTWATHAIAHVMEMEGRQEEGIAFMSKTVNNWKPCKSLASHNFWHWALYHIERGEYEEALNIYDTEIATRFNSAVTFGLTDGSSLLYRLKFEGVDVGDRWRHLCTFWESHYNEHFLAFTDSHMLMSTLGAKNEALTLKLMSSLRDYIRDGSGPSCEISRAVGIAVCEAFIEADKGNFSGAVALLKPLRYKVELLGGSRAQRDVYELFLIYAALHSDRKEDHCFVRSLLAERKAKKQKAPMTDRLMARALTMQMD